MLKENDMPTHILIECPELIVSAKLGVIEPLRPLEASKKCELRFIKTIDIKRKDIVWADILITVRGCEPLTMQIVREAKRLGRMILYYLDDDLLHIPEESIAWDYYASEEVRKNIVEMIGMSDALWGVNHRIRDLYLQYGAKKWIENKVPVSYHQISQKKTGGPIKILYAGSVDHTIMIQEIITPVVTKLLETYGDRVMFTFIGADPGIKPSESVQYIPFISPYEKYRAFVDESGFDIGLAPGRESPFYACKYYNKFIEYTSIGAVGIYTDTDPYTQIVVNRENGLLCKNTTEDWCRAVSMLIDDEPLRHSCARHARELLKEAFSPAAVADSMELQCEGLVTYHAPKITAAEVRLYSGFMMFYLHRARLLWNGGGIVSIPLIFYKTCKILLIKGKEVLRSFGSRLFLRNS